MIDYFRKQKNIHRVSSRGKDGEDLDIFDRIDNNELNVEQVMINTQIKDDVMKLINRLPEDQREVVMLRHFEELSFKEISDLKNISINTALGRMRYALINLRKLMEKNKMTMMVE
jgi:RNA polymerase sigma-70 factor (ECF subfamily)